MEERRPRLDGKVAIVTGAGSKGPGIGNGQATAILFAREGAKVLLVDIYPKRMDKTLATIDSEGGEASVLAADVTDVEDCRKIVSAAIERYGKLDILHNNVGIYSTARVVDEDIKEWDRVMNINLKSMVLTSKFAIPAMIAGSGGSITNVSSAAALRPRNLDAYSTSKGAVIALTQAMASSHAVDRVRVN